MVANASTKSGKAVFTIQNDWQAGFTGQITVTNTGTVATNGWQIEIDTASSITAAWNGSITSQTPGKYIITNASYDGMLAPGASATFGFNLNRAPGSSAIAVSLASIGGVTAAPPAPAPTLTPAPAPTPAPTPTPPAAGTLLVNVSEDAYQGDAQFTVAVDGKQAGGTYAATASHAAGQSAAVAVAGSYAVGQHSVVVTFINDVYGGPGLDRNLYLNSVSLNGATQTVNAGLYSSGASSTVTIGAAPSPPAPTPAPGPTPTPAPAAGTFQYLGVNLSGLEFGIPDPNDGGTNAGTYGQNYGSPTHAEIDYYASEHLNTIRLPFSWERLQPVENGSLNATQLGYLDDVVHYAATKGMTVILDPHNYGYGYGNLIGSAGTPDAAFDSLWSQLAGHYATQTNVIFGLMNEPHVQSPAQWVQPVNDAISAIRATGAGQEILVSGTNYDGGATWVSSGNASIFAANVIDPDHKIAFEVHQYSDSDGSGSSASVVSTTTGADRLQAVTAWAEQTGNKLFLGEFGAGQDSASIANLTNMLTYMQQHTDVWQGGTEWGGGPLWGSYFFATDPQNGQTTPQVATLTKFTSHGATGV